MRSQIWLPIIGALLALPAFAAPKAEGTLKRPFTYQDAWQVVNQPYKRALYATNQGDAQTARRNLASLKTEWGHFRTVYQRTPPGPFREDKAWKADLVDVSRWIETAGRDVYAGRLPEAHNTLEQVRIRWMEMRTRARVPTFGDHLTRFHEPMETVVLTVKGKTPETVTEGDVARLRQALPDLKSVWTASRENAAGGSGPDAAKRRAMTEDVWRIITELDAAVQAGDRAAIVRAGSALRPAYAPLYMQFG